MFHGRHVATGLPNESGSATSGAYPSWGTINFGEVLPSGAPGFPLVTTPVFVGGSAAGSGSAAANPQDKVGTQVHVPDELETSRAPVDLVRFVRLGPNFAQLCRNETIEEVPPTSVLNLLTQGHRRAAAL